MRRPVAVVALVVAGLLASACSTDEPARTAATSGDTTIGATPTANSTTEALAAFEVRSGIEYGRAEVGAPEPGSAPLLLDLYVPTTPASDPRAAVVLIHGGGFRAGTRTDEGIVQVAEALAADGVVVASIDYRLFAQEPVPSERVGPLLDAMPSMPLAPAVVAAVDDGLTAIDWLLAGADELGIDPDRLGVIGSSAGAITADHLGYVLDDHGIEVPALRLVGSLWGGMLLAGPDGSGDPTEQLAAGEPALFVVHGDADTSVDPALSEALAHRARAVGVPVEYHVLPGGEHGYGPSGFFTALVDGEATAFLRLRIFVAEQLGGPASG